MNVQTKTNEIAKTLDGLGSVHQVGEHVVLHAADFILTVVAGSGEAYVDMNDGADPEAMHTVYDIEDLEDQLAGFGVDKIDVY